MNEMSNVEPLPKDPVFNSEGFLSNPNDSGAAIREGKSRDQLERERNAGLLNMENAPWLSDLLKQEIEDLTPEQRVELSVLLSEDPHIEGHGDADNTLQSPI